ncbi:MAG TPA: CAP domain-containing protein [Actinobacteria bacterium]|nr:CAP domain-containing protein [Actinomycetota bacterium]
MTSALFALVLAVAMILLVASPARADATSDAEACFLSKINAARTATGAQTLQRDASLAGYARVHSQAMAADGSIYHSSTSDLAPYLPNDWVMWGENVGVGGTCAVLFDAFMASPLHKEILLKPVFQYVGIGVYIDGDGTLWTTHIFLQRQTATTTTTTTAPPATTTTTTPPPTTTTTPTAPPSTTTTPPPPAAPPPTTPPAAATPTAPPATTTPPGPPDPSNTEPQAASALGTINGPADPTGPAGTGSLTAAIRNWKSDGILCNDPECGGDQALLALIGAFLLSGSIITTWALRA